MSRPTRSGEAAASAATVLLAVAAVVTVDGSRWWLGALFSASLLWSALPLITHVLGAGAHDPQETPSGENASGAHPSGEPTTVAVVIRLGDEPLDIARTTILLAVGETPTFVLSSRGAVPPELRELGATVIESPTFPSGIDLVLSATNADALLITSARAVPLGDACRDGAGRLRDDIGWVIGRSRSFAADGYVADRREPVTATLRAHARRSGLVAWEPDATLVRTDLLRAAPFRHRRSLGSWLRERAADGRRGVDTDAALVRRVAPVDASAYWPDAAARQWGRVVDLVGALTTRTPAGRVPGGKVAAAGLLARELFAVPALVWTTVPVLTGSGSVSPYPVSWLVCSLLAAAVGVGRYVAVHRSVGVPLRPRQDVAAALHAAPGSLLAVGAVATRRLPRHRLHLSSRPLVWAALVSTVVSGHRLIDSTGARSSPFTIAVSLASLGLLWAFSMGALAQRNWARTTYRVPLSLEVWIDGTPYRTVNGAPAGIGVDVGNADLGPLGTRLPIALVLDDGEAVASTATVVGRRRLGTTDVVGLSLDFGETARASWSRQLSRAAETTSSAHRRATPVPPTVDDDPRRTAGDRIVAVLVGAVSVTLASLLLLVMLGYRPFVIRSGSMEPTLHIGDVVLSEEVAPAALRPGDIANIPTASSDGTGTLTHRVMSVADADGDPLGVGIPAVVVNTRGDANPSGETTVLDSRSLAGRVRVSIPWIGRPATAVRTSPASLWAALALLTVVLVAVLARPRRHAGRRSPVGSSSDATSCESNHEVASTPVSDA